MEQTEALKRAIERRSVWIVYGFSWQYAIAEVYITEIIQESFSDFLRFVVEHPVTKENVEFYTEQLYEDEKTAWEERGKLQSDRGSVIISQKEYDEYQRLKAQAQPPKEG